MRKPSTIYDFALWPMTVVVALLMAALLVMLWFYQVELRIPGVGIVLFKGGMSHVTSPENATVEMWHVEEGDVVHAGDRLVTLTSHVPPFTKQSVNALKAGMVAEITAYPGSKVVAGESLALLSAEGDRRHDLELVGFVSSLEGKKIRPGMSVSIALSTTDTFKDGVLLGRVAKVGKLPASKASIASLVKVPELAHYLAEHVDAEPFLVVVALEKESSHPSGYQWQGKGISYELDAGIIARFAVVYDAKPLLRLVWPGGEP